MYMYNLYFVNRQSPLPSISKLLSKLDELLVERIEQLEEELRCVRLTSATPLPISNMILSNNEAPPTATPTETTPTPVHIIIN